MSDRAQSQAQAQAQAPSREAVIIKTSILGIATNVLLALFKAGVGALSHSIAIMLDAINNLSDALSSVITIVGTKLAGKAPDRKHPLGYGRIEYLTATLISVLVLYAGISSAVESIRKVIHPEAVDYSAVTLIIVAAGVIAKIMLGAHVKKVGKKVNADSLVASGQDSLSDALLSAATLAAALVYLLLGISLEAWVAAIISAFIIKAGLELLGETLGLILGERVDASISTQVKELAAQEPEVFGVYDLVLSSYGPEHLVGSLHVEVSDTTTAEQIDELTRRIQKHVYVETQGKVTIAAVGIYSRNTTTDISDIRERIEQLVFSHDHVLQMHGLHVDKKNQLLDFDIILSFDAPDREAEYSTIAREVQTAFPNYRVRITLDSDVSD